MPAPRALRDVARVFKAPDFSASPTSILIARAAEGEVTSPSSTGGLLSAQWTNPSDVLSVLLIIGGDIVQKALAETSGGLFTPVCFSFGWVAYSFTALVNILGNGRLLPEPDYPVKVFNLENGYMRENRHWVIGRIVRDNETFMTKKHPLKGGALRISIYEAGNCTTTAAVAGSGRVRFWGIITMLLQFGVAAVPVGLYREWGVMMITGTGTVLALAAGALPQWRAEKLPSKRNAEKNFALSSGNGSRDIMIILGRGNSLDLEELASSESPRSTRIWEKIEYLTTPVYNADGSEKTHGNGVKVRETRMLFGMPLGLLMTGALCTAQSILWIALLITVAGLKSHSWFILAVGALGMFQNAFVAAISRNSSKRNLPLILVDHIISRTVMDGLMDLEITFPGQAPHLVKEFFPEKLRVDEVEWWKGNRDKYDDKRCRENVRRGDPRSRMPQYQNSNNFKISDHDHEDDHDSEDDHETNTHLTETVTPAFQDSGTPYPLSAATPKPEIALNKNATPSTLLTTNTTREDLTLTPPRPGGIDIPEKADTPLPPKAAFPATLEEVPSSTIPGQVFLKEPPDPPAPISGSGAKPPSPKKPKGPVHFAENTVARDFAPKQPARAMTQPELKSAMHEGRQTRNSASLSVDEIYKIVQSPDWS